LNAVYTNNTDTTPVSLTPGQLANAASLPAGYDYDLQLSMSVTGLAAGENFGNALINFAGMADAGQSSGALASDLAGTHIDWSGNSSISPLMIGKTSYPYFKNNEVDGTYPGAQSVFVAFVAPVANAANPGATSSVLLGDLWVNWNGTTPTLLSPTGVKVTGTNDLSTWENNSTGAGTQLPWVDGTYTIVSNGVQFGAAIPEPATMSLLVLGGIGALLRRRK
jgi:hypothetical protein